MRKLYSKGLSDLLAWREGEKVIFIVPGVFSAVFCSSPSECSTLLEPWSKKLKFYLALGKKER